MTPWDGLNRRKFPRVNYPCMVTVVHDEEVKDVILTHTENVGIGGIGVVIKHKLKMFTPVSLELDLLDMGEHINCKGKVVWVVQRRGDSLKKPLFYDIGIEFVDIPEEDRSRINVIVTKIAQKQGDLLK